MIRPSRDVYFLMMAAVTSTRSSCTSRAVGCVLVDENHHVLATGYNGPPSGLTECHGAPCKRKAAGSGNDLDNCNSIHAEQNAMLQCADVKQIYTAYLTVSPCIHCVRMLANTGCRRIVFVKEYPSPYSQEMWKKLGREWEHFLLNAHCTDVFGTILSLRS